MFTTPFQNENFHFEFGMMINKPSTNLYKGDFVALWGATQGHGGVHLCCPYSPIAIILVLLNFIDIVISIE